MKLRHVVETTSQSGQKSRSATDYEGDEIIIGRGGSAKILIESTLVSLEHAKFSIRNDKLFISDLNSLSGVRVNGTVCAEHALKAGDTITIGDSTFTVFYEDGIWGLSEHRVERIEEDVEDKVKRIAHRLTLDNRLPKKSVLSALLFLVVFGFYGIRPLLSSAPASWTSGPLGENHRFLENQCSACHAKPFERVKDSACLSCHALSKHSELITEVAEHQAAPGKNCADCHQDHNGSGGIIPHDLRTCTTCHANISDQYPDATSKAVASFAAHPEFRVTVWDQKKPGETLKIPITDPALVDVSGLKFSHKAHLDAPLDSPEGDVTLQCNDCHTLDANFTSLQPLSFEKSCRGCHSLEFDERLPKNNVPHAEPDVVFNYMYAEYAKLLLSPDKSRITHPSFARTRPGEAPNDRSEDPKFSKEDVENSAREAEEELFEKKACHLCHSIEPVSLEAGEGTEFSRYALKKPLLPHRWYPAVNFNHGSHEELQCVGCHTKSPQSEETSDVLLPELATCQNCHADHSRPGKVATDCIDCHSFHDSESLPMDAKQSLEELLRRSAK